MATKVKTPVRPLYTIANEIRKDWKNMPEYAKAHFRAIQGANRIDESYGLESVKSEVCYFLSNAGSWRGEVARRVKKELKKMAGI